jgi:hypothetical protein
MKNPPPVKPASVSEVVHSVAEAPVRKPRKGKLMSAWLPPEIVAKIPPGLGLAKFIIRLVKCKIGFYDEEIARYAAWSAVSLDRLISEVAERLPDDANEPLSCRIDRLIALAEFKAEVAQLRSKMEELIDAR